MFNQIKQEFSQISNDIRAGLNLTDQIFFTEKQILGFNLYDEQKAWVDFAFTRNNNLTPKDVEVKNIQF